MRYEALPGLHAGVARCMKHMHNHLDTHSSFPNLRPVSYSHVYAGNAGQCFAVWSRCKTRY